MLRTHVADVTVVLSTSNKLSCVGRLSLRNVGMTINIATQIWITASKTFHQSLKISSPKKKKNTLVKVHTQMDDIVSCKLEHYHLLECKAMQSGRDTSIIKVYECFIYPYTGGLSFLWNVRTYQPTWYHIFTVTNVRTSNLTCRPWF